MQHLKSFATKPEGNSPYSTESSGIAAWKRTRLHRMLVDHLLREGMYETSKLLATNLHIEHLTNIEVRFLRADVLQIEILNILISKGILGCQRS